jgi:hypothetical protein
LADDGLGREDWLLVIVFSTHSRCVIAINTCRREECGAKKSRKGKKLAEGTITSN